MTRILTGLLYLFIALLVASVVTSYVCWDRVLEAAQKSSQSQPAQSPN
jgi:hypothetical protein